MNTKSDRVLIAAVSLTILLAISAFAQTRKVESRHIGLPQDWSQQHFVFTERGDRRASLSELVNPRAIIARLARARARASFRDSLGGGGKWNRPVARKKPHVDWAVDLGATMTPNTYPAKYSFDINATPDCVNDYVVYGLNTAGIASQANLIGLNYLYSGGTDGICNNLAGNGTSAKVYWAYAVPNAIQTSTVISLDGTKIAFLESGTPATFHVLAWKANDGAVAAPTTPTPTSSAPVSGTGEMTSLSLSLCGGFPSTVSSPYVDYGNDVAYIANDNGCLFRIKDVFCTTATCISNPVAPSFDLVWGGTGVRTLLTGTQLGSPVYDSVSDNIFVGSTDGRFFGINATTQQLTPGAGGQPGAGPFPSATDFLVDSYDGFVYLYLPNASGIGISGDAVVLQYSTANTSSLHYTRVGSGLVDKGPVYTGAFNDAYFTNSNPATWYYYVCNYASGAGSTAPVLYRVSFDVSRFVAALPSPATVNLNGGAADQCASSLLEFKGNDNVDRLFYSLVTGGTVNYVDISGATPAMGPATPVSSLGGTTGIVVDNISTAGQASSIYYMQLGGTNAVKLTQAALQ